MSISPGTRLGAHEILAPLGAGGMGEVYRAKDTRLGREVAVKVLPAGLAGDAGRLRRFEQEARAVSALNHPHIVTLHEVGMSEHGPFLVLELVAGRTLRELLRAGALPIKRVLQLGAQIAEGLAKAHAAGIVHRDLKPENVMVSEDGFAKILDFGLAKLVWPDPEANAPGATQVDTLAGRTASGVILGTPGYLSPEQALGKQGDFRADHFALGALLYEMATGEPPFRRQSAAESLAAVIRDEPEPLRAKRPDLPPQLGWLVARCLAKDPVDRYAATRDLARDLADLRDHLSEVGRSDPTPRTGARTPPRPGLVRTLRALGLAALVVAGVVVGVLLPSPSSAPPAVAFGAGSLAQITTDPGYEGEPTFSPDGRTIAYVSDRDGNFEIYLQQVSGGPAINLTRDDGADVQPAFSPDGREIAFVSTRTSSSDLFHAAASLPMVGGDIWTMPALGGTPRRIVENGNFPSWSPDGSTLVYVHGTFRDTHLALVPAEGGTSRDLEIEETFLGRYFFPSFSQDGRWILYQNGGRIEVVAAVGGRGRELAVGSHPAWGPGSQSVIFTNGAPGKSRTLWQAPFALDRGELAGPASPLTFGRGSDLGARISLDGRTIVFAAVEEALNLEELPFDAESGRVLGPPRELTSGTHHIAFFDVAPDGSALAYTENLGAGSQIWRLDPPAPPVQLTLEAGFTAAQPTWSPDGREIAFLRRSGDEVDVVPELWIMRADGGSPRRLADGISRVAWLADAKRLVAQRGDQLMLFDLATGGETPIEGARTRTLVAVDAQSQWVVYQAGESGGVDLAAVPLAGGTPRVVVATPHEDFHPFFSPSGRWLYFQTDHKNIARVPGPAQGWRPAEPEWVTAFPDRDLFLEDPKLARDGGKLYYTRGRTSGDLWILRTDARGSERGGR
jgi:eukaryotic-like serine/threonine-protein kinase